MKTRFRLSGSDDNINVYKRSIYAPNIFFKYVTNSSELLLSSLLYVYVFCESSILESLERKPFLKEGRLFDLSCAT